MEGHQQPSETMPLPERQQVLRVKRVWTSGKMELDPEVNTEEGDGYGWNWVQLFYLMFSV